MLMSRLFGVSPSRVSAMEAKRQRDDRSRNHLIRWVGRQSTLQDALQRLAVIGPMS